MSEQERENEQQTSREDEVKKWKIGQHRELDWQQLLQEQIAAGLVAEKAFHCPTCGAIRRNRICPVCGSVMDLKSMTETVHGDESAK